MEGCVRRCGAVAPGLLLCAVEPGPAAAAAAAAGPLPLPLPMTVTEGLGLSLLSICVACRRSSLHSAAASLSS